MELRTRSELAMGAMEEGSLGATRVGGALRCIQGEPARRVAEAVGTDDRVVLAWLHVLRVGGLSALIDHPPSQPSPSRKTRPSTIDHALLEDVYVTLRRSLAEMYLAANSTGRPRKIGNTSTIRAYLRGDGVDRIRTRDGLKTISAVVRRLHEFEVNGSIGINVRSSKVIFDEEFRCFVRKVVMAGYDPDEPGRMMTFDVLARLINERYGTTYKVNTMPYMMRRIGIRFRHSRNFPPSESRLVADENIALVRGLPDVEAA